MLARDIAEQIADLPPNLSDKTSEAATRALIDWVAAAISGADHPAALALRDATSTIAGQGKSVIIGSDRVVDARTAALINATASHATEVDDIYRDGLYHPGAPTIAAALALSQASDSSGRDLLRAIAIGYQVSCRIATVINPAHYNFWHTTGTVGAFGAAIASASILGLAAEPTANALAIATTATGGLQQSFRSEAMAKPFHAGHAADLGVLAALSARSGFTGALDVLEGPVGFGAAMSSEVDWSPVLRSWDEPWAVAEVTVKNHTACGHTFAPIDAMLGLREKFGLQPDEVEHILIETAQIPINVAGNQHPTTEFEAKFSIPYCVASALIIGSVRLAAFSEQALKDPTIRDLMARIELRDGQEFDAVFPQKRAARVVVTLKDGRVLTEEAWTRRGDPEAPLSNSELSEKFIELTTPVLGSRAELTLDALWRTSEMENTPLSEIR